MKYLEYLYGNDENAYLGYAYTAKMMRQAFRNNGVSLNHEAQTVLAHSVPWDGFSWGSKQRAGIFSMWEFTDLPPVIKSGLMPFDFALAPSRHSADLFAEYVDESLVCPHGIDAEHYKPNPDYKRKDSRFTVISPCTNRRKGAHELVDAFEKADIPNSRLLLKGPRKSVARSVPDNVEFVGDLEDMRELYWQADLAISCSHGEGWDLITWEALACGVPVIVPKHTAYLDWMHFAQDTHENWHVEYRDLSLASKVGCRIPDIAEVAEKLNVAYRNQDTYKVSALKSSEEIRAEHTWDQEVARFLPSLGDLPAADAGTKSYHEVLVPVKALRFIEYFDIADVVFGPMREGVTYWLDGDKARVLIDSGYVEFNEPALRQMEPV